ncbi:class C sortase [Corynebacterium choanae]|uniref:Sortase family protein n=1 Tax=Corynebacterium choanae TaxID=1862358 RepID=A0A3G6J8W8_9CORY|nr:class C sortase [Corynebacterium choanae]AZA14565.1 Sortase family protein [Corynebacterium choanae]
MTIDTPTKPIKGESRKQQQGIRSLIVPIVLVLLGVMIVLYPVVATQWNNVRQMNVAEQYTSLSKEIPPEQRAAALDEAQAYNAQNTTGPVFDPWLARVSEDNRAYQEYLGILGNGERVPMATILIPKITVKLPLFHGSDEWVLQHGAGHLFGSSMPVGGPSTHAVITGHTGITNATLFDNLINVKEGDSIYLKVYEETLKYQVNEIRVVLPEETSGLDVVPGKDLITLITCTPYGINSHRLLVTAERVPIDAAEAAKVEDEATAIVWQWWMWIAIAVAALALLFLLWWLRGILGRRKRDEQDDEEAPLAQLDGSSDTFIDQTDDQGPSNPGEPTVSK